MVHTFSCVDAEKAAQIKQKKGLRVGVSFFSDTQRRVNAGNDSPNPLRYRMQSASSQRCTARQKEQPKSNQFF